MISLAAPLGLLALLALAVPIIVHLWRPPPRTVRVGSLRFLREAARLPVRHLRWRELLRLALRCLLFAALALLLAQPLWRGSAGAKAKWALRSPDARPTAEQEKAWDALLREGFEERWLAPGFPRKSEKPEVLFDVWSLLAEADASLPADGALAVLAPPRLLALRGLRPTLTRSVRWLECAGEAEQAWVERLDAANAGQPARLTFGLTTPTETRFQTGAVPSDPPKGRISELSAFAVRPLPDGLEVSLNERAWQRVSPTPALRVAVLHAADRGEDARYVRAALQALNLQLVREQDDADWAIVLGDGPAPPTASRILRDDATATPNATASTFAGQRLHRRVAAPAEFKGVVRERDGFGQPLLLEQSLGDKTHVQILTRFHPDWMEAAGNSALPVWLGQLLQPPSRPAHDLRLAALTQAQPAVGAARTGSTALPSVTTDLSPTLWLAALLLFAVERLWSHRLAHSEP